MAPGRRRQPVRDAADAQGPAGGHQPQRARLPQPLPQAGQGAPHPHGGGGQAGLPAGRRVRLLPPGVGADRRPQGPGRAGRRRRAVHHPHRPDPGPGGPLPPYRQPHLRRAGRGPGGATGDLLLPPGAAQEVCQRGPLPAGQEHQEGEALPQHDRRLRRGGRGDLGRLRRHPAHAAGDRQGHRRALRAHHRRRRHGLRVQGPHQGPVQGVLQRPAQALPARLRRAHALQPHGRAPGPHPQLHRHLARVHGLPGQGVDPRRRRLPAQHRQPLRAGPRAQRGRGPLLEADRLPPRPAARRPDHRALHQERAALRHQQVPGQARRPQQEAAVLRRRAGRAQRQGAQGLPHQRRLPLRHRPRRPARRPAAYRVRAGAAGPQQEGHRARRAGDRPRRDELRRGGLIGNSINILESLGGLGLFLFALRFLTGILDRSIASRLRPLLNRFLATRGWCFLVGLGVTVVFQASSITIVTAMGLLNSGLITLDQGFFVTLGATVGTTLKAWLFAQEVHLGPALIGVSSISYLFVRRPLFREALEMVLAIGLVFLGLDLMGLGLQPLRSDPIFLALFDVNAAHLPGQFLGVLMGCLLTLVTQSSSATVFLVLDLATQGAISFPAGAALILGENIGTTITTLIAAVEVDWNGKRLALAYLITKVAGVASALLLFPLFIAFIDGAFNTLAPHAGVALRLAAVHTWFNLMNAGFWTICAHMLIRFLQQVTPAESGQGVALPTSVRRMLATSPE
ncbi:MAG: Na/Pi cotransporter family protein, partial [Chloroflexi bacterium]|nr:Na/Pi cotransporter family protein [Chloroflexota bacterium]